MLVENGFEDLGGHEQDKFQQLGIEAEIGRSKTIVMNLYWIYNKQ